MARRELQDYEHQIVQLEGWVDRWTHRDESDDILITAVKIRPYRLDETLLQRNEREPARTDHLWLRASKQTGCPDIVRLDAVYGYARVGWYTRRDGSADLGCTPVPSVHGSVIADEIKSTLARGQWPQALTKLRSISQRIQKMELIVFDEQSAPAAIIEDIEARILPMVRKNRDVSLTAKRAGKSRAPRAFADLLR